MEWGTLLKLKKPVYCLSESGKYWGRILSKHIVQDLNMRQYTLDPVV